MILRGAALIQFRSNSISRSATALAALVRVSLTFLRREIYVNVSRIEPIFHLETLAGSLPCSRPEKKWLLLLARLARETLIAVRTPSCHELFDPVRGKNVWGLQSSWEHALHLRQRLKRALEVYRCARDSLSTHVKPERPLL